MKAAAIKSADSTRITTTAHAVLIAELPGDDVPVGINERADGPDDRLIARSLPAYAEHERPIERHAPAVWLSVEWLLPLPKQEDLRVERGRAVDRALDEQAETLDEFVRLRVALEWRELFWASAYGLSNESDLLICSEHEANGSARVPAAVNTDDLINAIGSRHERSLAESRLHHAYPSIQ